MSAEQNKSIVRRWIEDGWNGRNLALIDELYDAHVIQHDPAAPVQVANTEALKQYVAVFQNAMPDLHFAYDGLIAEGDKVVWQFTARGTQKGELMGIPPTGKSVAVTGIAIFRLHDSKIVEVWVNFDALGMLQHLGVIPTMSA